VTYRKACHSWDCMVPTHGWLVTSEEHAERSRRIMEEAFGSVGIRPTITITAFNQDAQDAC
jgi:hypothetical protein